MIGACVLYVSWCFGFCHRSVAKMSTRAYLEALRDEMDIFITTVEASQVELGQMEVASEAAHKDLAIAKTVGSSVNIAGKAGLIFGIVCPPLLLAGGITHAVGTMTNMATDVVHAGFHGYVFWVLLTS